MGQRGRGATPAAATLHLLLLLATCRLVLASISTASAAGDEGEGQRPAMHAFTPGVPLHF